jgi:hypothetical protein
VYCVAYYSNLMMEAKCSLESSVEFKRTTQYCIPEDLTLLKKYDIYNEVVQHMACSLRIQMVHRLVLNENGIENVP